MQLMSGLAVIRLTGWDSMSDLPAGRPGLELPGSDMHGAFMLPMSRHEPASCT